MSMVLYCKQAAPFKLDCVWARAWQLSVPVVSASKNLAAYFLRYMVIAQQMAPILLGGDLQDFAVVPPAAFSHSRYADVCKHTD